VYQNIELRFDIANQLPEDGSVFDWIPQVEASSLEDHVQEYSKAMSHTSANNVTRRQTRNPAPRRQQMQDEEPEDDDVSVDQLALGPEQRGASGEHEEDLDEEALAPSYLPRPVQPIVNVEDELHAALGSRANPLQWPAQGDVLSDYDTCYLQAMCFPHLLPHKHRDATQKDRLKEVSLTAATRHLLWYAYDDGHGNFR